MFIFLYFIYHSKVLIVLKEANFITYYLFFCIFISIKSTKNIFFYHSRYLLYNWKLKTYIALFVDFTLWRKTTAKNLLVLIIIHNAKILKLVPNIYVSRPSFKEIIFIRIKANLTIWKKIITNKLRTTMFWTRKR